MRVDLHCHSTASDGVLAPAALVQRAHEKGVGLLALTDHDTLEGLPEAHQAAARLGIELVNGVELSCTWGGATIHVLGYGFDLDAAPLRQATEALHRGRWARAEKSTDGWRPRVCPGRWRARGRSSGLWATAATRRRGRISPSSWSRAAGSRIAPTRSASGWGPASWETSSSTGRPWRKWSAACARRAPGSAWRTRTIMISPGPSAGAWSPTFSRPVDTPSRWSMACSRPNRSVPCRSWPASSA